MRYVSRGRDSFIVAGPTSGLMAQPLPSDCVTWTTKALLLSGLTPYHVSVTLYLFICVLSPSRVVAKYNDYWYLTHLRWWIVKGSEILLGGPSSACPVGRG